jgi:AbiV family abortive infection protein
LRWSEKLVSSFIPSSELEEGIQKSLENAVRYFEDAVFLFRNKRYLSSILLSMHSYEESGKALLLVDYDSKKKEISKSQWNKKFCSHQMKNLVSLKTILEDVDNAPEFPDIHISVSRLNVNWKNIFTYSDYDFERRNWTSPLDAESIGISDVKSHSSANIVRAGKALRSAIERAMKIKKLREDMPQIDEVLRLAMKIVKKGPE